MALIKCAECGKEISNTLKTCPNCGIEIKNNNNVEKQKTSKLDIAIIITLSLFSFVVIIKDIFNFYAITMIYEFIYIMYLWFIFLFSKSKKSLFKILSIVSLVLCMIVYILNNCLSYFFDKMLIKMPNQYTFMGLIITFAPLIVLLLVSIKGEKNGNN